MFFTALDRFSQDIKVAQPCSHRFSFSFGAQPLIEGQTFTASFSDAWSRNPPPHAPPIPVRYRFCASGPRLRWCTKDSYDLTRYTGVSFKFRHARRGRYTFRIYIGADRISTASVQVHTPPLPVLLAGTYQGIKPRAVYFSGDGGNIVTGIRWSSWTHSSATGEGTSNILGCVPDCAQGTATPVPTTILLSRPQGGHFTLVIERRVGQTYIGHYGSSWPGGAG